MHVINAVDLVRPREPAATLPNPFLPAVERLRFTGNDYRKFMASEEGAAFRRLAGAPPYRPEDHPYPRFIGHPSGDQSKARIAQDAGEEAAIRRSFGI